MKKFKIVFYLLLVAAITLLSCYLITSFCTLELDFRKWHTASRIITVIFTVTSVGTYALRI